MRRLLTLLAALALLATACGKTKDLNPMLGPGGGSDNARFGFEDGTLMGFVKGTINAPTSVDQVFVTDQAYFAGRYCLGVHVTGLDALSSGNEMEVERSLGSPTDLTGKTITCWIYIPVAAQASDKLPTYSQIYLKTAASYANSPGVNLTPGNWTRVSFTPLPNASAVPDTSGGAYIGGNFDPALVTLVGVKAAPAGAAGAGFSFTGTILVDSIDW